jgi:hypothetical protein
MRFRIVKEFRNANTRIGKERFYIQQKWLFGWQDIDPYDIDAWFHGKGRDWDTFEEALEVYKLLEEVMKIKRNKIEVVWPPPRREF